MEAIKHPEADGLDIATSAFSKINTKDAILTGAIDFVTLDNKTKNYLDCALKMLRRFEDGGTLALSDIKKGTMDCIIIASVRYSFNRLRNTDQVTELVKAISDRQNYDVILNKLSQIVSQDAVDDFVQTLTENGIIKGSNVVWD
ncbi:MAG: hypothetical protein ACOC22_04490 [bacterium]